MKQKFSRALFLGMMFFVGVFFVSSVRQVSADMVTGTNCTGSNGYQGTCIATNGDCSPTTRTKSSSSDCGSTADFTCCTNEPPASTSVPATDSECATAAGYTCSENGCAGGISAGPCGDFGICCKGGASTPSTPTPNPTPSPTPTTTNPPANNGNASNRPPASGPAGGASTSGLYIPRGSEIGLSEMKVSDLIQNFMLWLLYIVGFVAIIAFVISGLQYLLSAGNEKMAEKAKANMQYAIIGVVVALSALIIIRAIQGVLSGAWIF